VRSGKKVTLSITFSRAEAGKQRMTTGIKDLRLFISSVLQRLGQLLSVHFLKVLTRV